ncbi:SUMF1/EgtB/PvdO family nonheme iron enzyme, partial [Candidatus Poribacteria bacterium]|nr:SUMF1/EgtB/PvdO family nonheme iron enzyme [Candidatus Poribacteria bacterium]
DYMSPEQILSKTLDGRTDVYSLGATLYHLATGRPPFVDGNEIALCMKHVNEAPADPRDYNPNLPDRLCEAILRSLQKEPVDRYDSAGEMADDLSNVLRSTQEAPPPSRTSPPIEVGAPKSNRPITRVVEPEFRGPAETGRRTYSLPDTDELRLATEKHAAEMRAAKPPEPDMLYSFDEDLGLSTRRESNEARERALTPPPEYDLPPALDPFDSSPVGRSAPPRAEPASVTTASHPPPSRPPAPPARGEETPPPPAEPPSAEDSHEPMTSGLRPSREKRRLGLDELANKAETTPALGGHTPSPMTPMPLAPSKGGWKAQLNADNIDVTMSMGSMVFIQEAEKKQSEMEKDAGRNIIWYLIGGMTIIVVIGVIALILILLNSRRGGSEEPSPAGGEETAQPAAGTPSALPDLPVPAPPVPDPGLKSFRLELPGGAVLNMVEVPSGTFTMGSSLGEYGRDPDEGPATEVTVTAPFFISDTEITRKQYRAIMGAKDVDGADDSPVTGMTWADAMYFCGLLSRKSPGVTATLPTEAQWEYACRSRSASAFNVGEILTSALANINGETPYYRAPKSENPGLIKPVKSYPPNAWKLYDMHGNAWEYTRDAYASNLPGGKVVDPVLMGTRDDDHVIRGGSFREAADQARSASRAAVPRDTKADNIGFRIVVESVL